MQALPAMFKSAIPMMLLLCGSLFSMTPTLADNLGAAVGKGVIEPPTRNAIPGDTEEMNDRELRIRRNMENTGTPYGTGDPAPNQHIPPARPAQPNQPMPKNHPATGPRG
jgi:hypothetical protein